MTQEIKVLITDDHSLFRESLSRFLTATGGFRVVGECASVKETVATFPGTEPDVILLDYDLGAEQGLELLTEIKRNGVKPRVLVVTAGMPETANQYAMNAGASGIFLKRDNLDQLLSAIHSVADGEAWVDRVALRTIIANRNLRDDPAPQRRPLTARQSEVLRGILDGLTNKEIAMRVNGSESSVKAVIQELFHKAGVRTRSQLVRIAIERHSSDWIPSQSDPEFR